MPENPPKMPVDEVLAAIMEGTAVPLPAKVPQGFNERRELGHKSVWYVLTGPKRGFATPMTAPLEKQRRRAVLSDEIAMAMSTATNPHFPNSVFVELIKLAERKYGCLVGVDDDVIKYQVGGIVKFFSLQHLRARIDRARMSEKSR
ncbi:MAG: hypothetical protein WKG03_05420 [Telluria sp.]